MSQFNNPYPQQPYGQKPLPLDSNYNAGPQPQPSSSGSKIILIVLGLVFGILLLIVLACGALGFIASRAVSTIGKEFENVIVTTMANDMVQRYQDHAAVQEHLGDIKEYQFETPGFDLMNRPVLRLKVEGEKGEGKIVFYRRFGRPQKVVLEVNGQEILLDDNPGELFESHHESHGFEDWDVPAEPPQPNEPAKHSGDHEGHQEEQEVDGTEEDN